MPKLNQIVAIEKGEKVAVNKETAPLFHAAKNAALFNGLTKTYEPRDEDGPVYPEETVPVQRTVVDLLEAFAKPSTRLLDVILTKEAANQEARADVVVDGQTILEQAPVSFLLQLEKYLQQEVRGLVVSLPTLDTAQSWEPSDSGDRGVSETPVTQRHKNKKVTRPMVLAPATDKHPAQVQLVNEDILEGYWNEKKFSGAVSGSRKQELIEKVDKLINAVKFAREEANGIPVTDKKVGASVFGYLFA
jgi:hypothetical protein